MFNWDALGAIGETVGAVGVIVSLTYLAYQIRSQNTESRLAAITEWTNQWNEWTGSFAENSQLSALWIKGAAEYDSLDTEELVQYAAHCGRLFRIAEGLFNQRNQGRLDEKTWQGLASTLQDICLLSGVRSWWPTRRHWYNEDFVAYIEPLVGSSETQTMYDLDHFNGGDRRRG